MLYGLSQTKIKIHSTKMNKFLKIVIFSSLFVSGLAHGIHFSQALINQMVPYTVGTTKETTKRNMSPLDDLFESTVISKRSTMDAADRSFLEQLSNVLTAPFKHNL